MYLNTKIKAVGKKDDLVKERMTTDDCCLTLSTYSLQIHIYIFISFFSPLSFQLLDVTAA